MDAYDLVIIGTGSGNTILDERFDGWRVAIVERGAFGGTCLNRGCVPSKMLIYPADVIDEMSRLGPLGVDTARPEVRWRDLRDRVFGRIDPIAADGERYRRSSPNVDVYGGDARFVGHKTLQVTLPDGTVATVAGEGIVLAAGARPRIPDVPGLEHVPFLTSDSIMRVDEVPRRLIVLGAGVIAVEQAHIFGSFGAEVVMVARSGRVLQGLDSDIAARFTETVSQRWEVHTSTMPREVSYRDGTFRVTLDHGPDHSVVEGDALLVATGRVPNGAQLGVTATGVELDAAGRVVTDDHLRTAVDGIWALGDVRSPHHLKHVANHEARVVRHNLLHPDDPIEIDERFVPAAVFAAPQVATVGITEAQAMLSGRDYMVTVREFGSVAYGWALDDHHGLIKLIADPESRLLLGAHIVGHQAAILLQQLVQGMRFGLTVDQMGRDVLYPHPALSEIVENALLDL